MRTASEVAIQLNNDLYGIPSDPWDERELKIITTTLTAFRNEAIEEAAKIVESKLLESLGRSEKAEVWLSNQIRALKK